MAMCPREHKRDILAQTSSGGEVLIFHNPRLAHRRKPWLLVTLQNVSRLQAPASSRGEEPLPAWPPRRAPHEIRTTGETSQGRRVPGGGQGMGATACQQCSGTVAAPCPAIAPARVGPAAPVPGRLPWDGPHGNSIARGCENLVRPHPYAVSPNNAIRSAQGRV